MTGQDTEDTDRDAPKTYQAEIIYQDSKGKSHRYAVEVGQHNVEMWIAHKDLMEGSDITAASRKHIRGRIVIPQWLANIKGLP